MKKEIEITVLVTKDYETLQKQLYNQGFEIKEEYTVNDMYLINSNIDIKNMKYLDILKNCILIRDVVGIEKTLLYKYKKYDEEENIIEQDKVKCPIIDTKKALEFLKAINYQHLFSINDKCIVYANDKTELIVQLVNNKYIYIEMESTCEYINKEYKNIEELKEDICSYNLSIDTSNFFVKKAEMILREVLTK